MVCRFNDPAEPSVAGSLDIMNSFQLGEEPVLKIGRGCFAQTHMAVEFERMVVLLHGDTHFMPFKSAHKYRQFSQGTDLGDTHS